MSRLLFSDDHAKDFVLEKLLAEIYVSKISEEHYILSLGSVDFWCDLSTMQDPNSIGPSCYFRYFYLWVSAFPLVASEILNTTSTLQ